MMTAMTAVNIFIFFILPMGFEGVRVDIHPPHLRVSEDPTNITVTCRSSAPITHCQFSWWSSDFWPNRAGPVLDLNLGAESVDDPAHLEDKHGYYARPLLGYSYSGRGFSRGDCGVRMEVYGWKTWLISCRVKTADTWIYDWMDLTADNTDPLPHTLERREVVVVPGGQARILLKTQGELRGCLFIPPVERWLDFDQGPSSSYSRGRHLYQGAGLSAGECGLALGNITERDNGLVESRIVKSSALSYDRRLTPLIVARPPTTPVLTVSKDGNHITATCRVQMSRPAPNITWFLGDQVILKDDSPGTEDDRWMWPWMGGPWYQTISVSIQPQDSGKQLKCSVTHVGLTQPLEAAKVVRSTVRVRCPPLRSDSVLISCFLGSEDKECWKNHEPNTFARLRCKPGYTTHQASYTQISCLKTGHWSQPLFNCSSECGKRKSTTGTALISNGTDAKVGQFPWHVGLFHGSEYWGAGTLIAPQVVLSAAHCFWEETLARLMDLSVFRVVAGGLSGTLDDPDPRVQRGEILRVETFDFNGLAGSYRNDIAVVFLKTAMVMSDTVSLVCVDWDSQLRIQTGDNGVVPGWGYTESGALSRELKYIDLPYVPRESCSAAVPSSRKSLVTYDKFCAGHVNASTSVCPGDSGGGLVFLDASSGSYFLKGVVSVDFRPDDFQGYCYSNFYAAYTNVSFFLEWIQDKTSIPSLHLDSNS